MKKLLGLRKGQSQPAPTEPKSLSTPTVSIKSISKLSPEELWRIKIKEVHSNSNAKPSVTDLQAITEHYLNRNRISDAEKWDFYLLSLIDQHDTKRSAFLSCVHALHPTTVRKSLLQFQDEKYMDLVLQVRSVNPDAVSNLEARCAENLKTLLSSPHLSYIQQLVLIDQALTINIDDDLRLKATGWQYGQRVCRKFRDYLNGVRQDLSWSTCELHDDSCSWLANLPNNSPVRELLSETGKSWMAWASWKPNRRRLEIWSTIPLISRQKLRAIMI